MFATTPSPLQVWAVDHESIQLCWGAMDPGPVSISTGDRTTVVDQPGGPGSLDLDGLAADTLHTVVVDAPGYGGPRTLSAHTMKRPPGELLARIATVNDLHLGATRWGFFKTMIEIDPATDPDHNTVRPEALRELARSPEAVPKPGHPPHNWRLPHAWRCAFGAVENASAWGAQLLVLKGDLAQHETATGFEHVGALVDAFPELPMVAIPGNHDVDHGGDLLPDYLGRRKVDMVKGVRHHDLPGLRVIVANSTVVRSGRGTVHSVASPIVECARESDRPILLLMHQQLQATRLPRYWPIGVPAPESTALLNQLDQLPQPVVISSGHTHRNRIRRHGSVTLTEVASTKDWPGVWAGYQVFEGGLIQTVRRTSDRSVLAWQEYSRRAVTGLWAHWSPGHLEDRCLAVDWARQPKPVTGLQAPATRQPPKQHRSIRRR